MPTEVQKPLFWLHLARNISQSKTATKLLSFCLHCLTNYGFDRRKHRRFPLLYREEQMQTGKKVLSEVYMQIKVNRMGDDAEA
jgi:hypothetical protein